MTSPPMDSGRDMDRLVTQRVLGWGVDYLRRVYGHEDNFAPSSNLSHAFEVADSIPRFVLYRYGTAWVAGSIGWDGDGTTSCYDDTYIDERIDNAATADTAPLAICRAALLVRS